MCLSGAAAKRQVEKAKGDNNSFSTDMAKVYAACHYWIAQAKISGYKLEDEHVLSSFLILDGQNWRSHMKQLFRYNGDFGSWDKCNAEQDEVLEVGSADRNVLLAAEGVLIHLSKTDELKDCSWSWPSVKNFAKDVLLQAHAEGDAINILADYAKEQSDHLRISTGNKAWKGHWCSRLADLVQAVRVKLSSSRSCRDVTKLFLKRCQTPKPKSQGVCFADKRYLDDSWTEKEISPGNDCYCRVDYKYEIKAGDLKEGWTLDRYKTTLSRFLRALYYKNEPFFMMKLHLLHLALKRICNGRWICEISPGGKGKGKEFVLESGVLGKHNCATLDLAVLVERTEFRRSAHFAWNTCQSRVQEGSERERILSDIWKRIAEDEELDFRVNYGLLLFDLFLCSLCVLYSIFKGLALNNVSSVAKPWCVKVHCQSWTGRMPEGVGDEPRLYSHH